HETLAYSHDLPTKGMPMASLGCCRRLPVRREIATDQGDGGERFDIRRRLGSGGMGIVYEAFDRRRNEVVALKKLIQPDPAAIYRLKQEFRSLAGVAHPNLVSLYELVNHREEWFFTMELVRGTTFLSYVQPSAGWSGDAPSQERTLTERRDFFDAASADSGQFTSPISPLTPAPMTPAPATRIDLLRPALRQLAEGVVALHQAGKLHR